MSEELDSIRNERDPIARAKKATDLLARIQQQSVELARLRKIAIEEAADQQGLTFAAVAAEIGLSKGRITQIRQSSPPAERGLFGVGPITVAVPTRMLEARGLPLISSEDAAAAEVATQLLTSLGFTVQQFRIPPDGQWEPQGDVFAICGPKSSPVTAQALADDPLLDFSQDDAGLWRIQVRTSGEDFYSPMDRPPVVTQDVAYMGRLTYPGGTMFLIAGVHAIGSVGAVEFLAKHAREIYDQVHEGNWSAIVRSSHDETGNITGSKLAWNPSSH